ncbi:hypothetical protein ACW9I5_04705 [Pseudomonas azotoformans]
MELVQLNDYRTVMQSNAAAFIKRHQQEHLHDDSLFDRTVNHLVDVWDVPVFMADRLVHLAMTERVTKGNRWFGIDMASGRDWCVFHDHRINKIVQLPNRRLPHRFLANPAPR